MIQRPIPIPLVVFFLIATLLMHQSCENAPTLTLPAKTDSGMQTFGCLIDNDVWVNYGRRCHSNGCEETNLTATVKRSATGRYELEILAHLSIKKTKAYQDITLSIDSLTSIGTYQSDGVFMHFRANDDLSFENEQFRKIAVTITKYDTINQIIAGEFSGQLTNEKSLETIEVKEGRFDLRFNQ